MSYNCAIVDDEFLARQYIRDYVGRLPFLNLVGDYDSPLLILEELKNKDIDILFLDIEMPDISGLDFLRTLNPQPYVILTTAYREYALEGYEYNVVDYLLKPFSFDRFLKAVNKAVDRAQKERQTAPGTAAPAETKEEYLTIRADRKLYKIHFDDLVYVEGQRAYVTLHTRLKNITALIAMKDLEAQLPADRFIRIHKSFIVSVRHMEALEGNLLEITGKIKLSIGTSYRDQVEQIFRIKS
jgi:DNA-binding LytR/AlgR family response regulator